MESGNVTIFTILVAFDDFARILQRLFMIHRYFSIAFRLVVGITTNGVGYSLLPSRSEPIPVEEACLQSCKQTFLLSSFGQNILLSFFFHLSHWILWKKEFLRF